MRLPLGRFLLKRRWLVVSVGLLTTVSSLAANPTEQAARDRETELAELRAIKADLQQMETILTSPETETVEVGSLEGEQLEDERAAHARRLARRMIEMEETSAEVSQADIDRLLDSPDGTEPDVAGFRGNRAPAIESVGEQPQGEQAHLYQLAD